MPRPIQLTVSVKALQDNLSRVRRHVGGRKIWAVVKARGYGHGIDATARGFAEADGFACLDLEEAVMLRELGVTKPIMLLEGIFGRQDVAALREYQLTCMVHHREQIEWLRALPARSQIPIGLKLNTGMQRLGFDPVWYRDAWLAVRRLSGVADVTLVTHFANADQFDGHQANVVTAEQQLAVFDQVTADLTGERCIANSAATARGGAFLRDAVRPGIILYGSSPFEPDDAQWNARGLGLRAAQQLSAEIIAIRNLETGQSVGYGSQFTAPHAMQIGVVACGYADGYPRVAPTGTPVAIDGRASRTVGRVSMDMLTVDLTGHDGARVGTPVELWGDDVPIDQVAKASGTIGYELMCAVTQRVPRRVVG